jgi:hypothetical protein
MKPFSVYQVMPDRDGGSASRWSPVLSLLHVRLHASAEAAKWRFQKVRETFYRESRLDIEQTTGLRNRETLIERLQVLKKRA